jgi:streptogramin lyase
MRSKLMLSFAASAAVVLFQPTSQTVWAQGQEALTGTVSSEAEGNMEGVVVTAKRPGSIVEVSVTTDAQGRYVFPENRLDPGEYALSIRAVGYDIGAPTKAKVEPEKTATADIKLKKAKNLASQLTNAEWMMSIPGTDDQKATLLNCQGCHTLERIMRSTHDSDEWTHVIVRMMGYGAVSQPIKPQRMLDPNRQGQPEQYRKMADYLATINLSSSDHWSYELKTLPRPKGRDTRAIVTQYDVVRPTSEPHDILVDKEGKVWYTDFGEMFIGKFDPKTLKLVEYPIKKFKDKAPSGLLSIEFDRAGDIWFDTMYQGSLGSLDPKTGEIAYYPLPPEYNDDRVQLNFTGLRYDVDGKVWTKSVGTQHIFRLDLATNTWERFHPTDQLPPNLKHAGIYQVIADSKNNLWMAEFTEGHLGKLDAEAVQIGDVREPRFREGAGSSGLGRRCTALLEQRDGFLDIRRFQAEVCEARRTLRVDLLQLDEGVLADLDVHGRHIALGVAVPERFLESHLLLVERRRVGDARHRDPHVVQHDARGVVLRHRGLDGQSTQNSCDE